MTDAVGMIAVTLQTNHLQALVHTDNIHKDIHIIKEIEYKLIDPMIRGAKLGALRETI